MLSMKKKVIIFGIVWLFDTVLIASLLFLANNLLFSLSSIFGVFLFSGWICLWLNGAIFLLLSISQKMFPGRIIRHFRYGGLGFFIWGMIGFNAIWVLWNRLTMAHQWASVRPFMTITGLFQSFFLAILFFVILFIGLDFKIKSFQRTKRVLLSLFTILLIFILLKWNERDEINQNQLPLTSIRAEISHIPNLPHKEVVEKSQFSPLIVLGIDGLEWNVLLPLAKAGRLPSIYNMIKMGTIGYLQNGASSLSAVIWPTIFSGRTESEHGIHWIKKIKLPGKNASLFNMINMAPSSSTFFGLGILATRIPNPGIWKFLNFDSFDIKVPMIWEVASYYNKRVVILNVLYGYPGKPVNGAMVNLRNMPFIPGDDFYPTYLSQRWHPKSFPDNDKILSDVSLNQDTSNMNNEVDFAVDLIREFKPNMAIYYTHYLDTIQHHNWDFYARDKFFLWRLPRDLNQRKWEELVLEYKDDRCFLSYVAVDQIINKFLVAFPNATLIILSDHGWDYSGYCHFTSPDGVIIISGPEAKKGTNLTKASIVDIVPTILALLKIPISKELGGSILTESLANEQKIFYVDKYEPFITSKIPKKNQEEEKKQQNDLQILRSFGYIK